MQLVEELVVMLPVFQVMMIRMMMIIMIIMIIMIMTMLQLLTTPELAVAARVCRAWHKVSLDPSLWTCVDLTRQVIVIMMMIMMMMMMIVMQRITAHLLSTTVQKQPVGLSLDWSSLGKQQLNWLVFIYYLFIYTTSIISTQYLHYIFTISAAAAAAPDQAAEPGGPGLHPDGVHPQHLQLSPAPGGLSG